MVAPSAGLLPSGARLFVHLTTSVQDSDSVALAAALDQPTGFLVNARLVVSATAPADAQSPLIARNAAVQLAFNRPPNAATLITNTDGVCSGSIQLSSTPTFTACEPMVSVTPVNLGATALGTYTFQVQPASPLAGSTVFYLRATTAVADSDGVSLAQQFTMASGFLTKAVFSLAGTTPSDGLAGVPRTLASVVVDFNRPALVSSITTNNNTTACTGSVQFSSGGFAANTCVPLGAPSASALNARFTLPVGALLAGSTTYKGRLVGVQEEDGIVLATATMSTGFTTKPALTLVSVSPSGAGVARNATFAVTFTRAASNVVTTASNDCTGATVQLRDAASGCVGASLASADGLAWTLTPLANLTPDADYSIFVDVGVVDSDGTQLPATSTTTLHSQPTLTVTTTPADGAPADQALNSVVQLDFNKAVTASTLTVNTANDSCTGHVQVSSDNFVHCVQMTAASPVALSATSFKLVPAAPLKANTQFLIKVQKTVLDASGFGLAADSLSVTGFHTKPAFTPSVTPVSGSVGVARTTTIDVAFTRAAKASTVTFNSSGTACSGTLQISSSSFGSCLPIASVTSADSITFHVVPLQVLPGSANIRVRAKASLQDSDGVPLGADIDSAGFGTSPQMSVASTPAAGGNPVALGTSIKLDFNVLPTAATVTGADAACAGSVQLFAQGSSACVPLGNRAVTNGGATITFTPAATLAASTLYHLRVTTAVQDAQGAPLDVQYDATFTTDTPPPAAVSGLAVSTTLQGARLTWTTADPKFNHANIYARLAGSGAYAFVGTGSTTGGTVTGLLPLTAYDFDVRAASALNDEGASALAPGVSTSFSGSGADWLSTQAAVGGSGSKFRLSWSNTMLVAGVSTTADATLLTNNQDVLWVAIDTDPAGSDTNGEVRTITAGTNDVIWPFKADYILELRPTGVGSTTVSLRTVAGNAGNNNFAVVAGSVSFKGAVDEVGIPKALLGSLSSARFALAAVNRNNGYSFALAPRNAAATDAGNSAVWSRRSMPYC